MPITEAIINNIDYEINYSLQVGDILYLSHTGSISGGFSVYGNVEVLGEVTEIEDNYIGFNFTVVGGDAANINAIINAVNPSYFISFRKEAAVNRNSLKGYFASCLFVNDDFNNQNELFVVNSQVALSSK